MSLNKGKDEKLRSLLVNGAQALELNLTILQEQHLLKYLALIQKWGRVYNLTALRDTADLLRLHILDTLTVARELKSWQKIPARILDVGTGAGLPGVVLAIVFPQMQILCVDSAAKKASFVRQVSISLALHNLQILHTRVEQLPENSELCIISRSFSALKAFVQSTKKVLRCNGVWLAMKGKFPAYEVQDLGTDVVVFHVKPLTVPTVKAERHLLYLCRRAELNSACELLTAKPDTLKW